MSVPFKVNAHLLAFVGVPFHPIFDRPRLNSGNCSLYVTSQTSRYRLGDSRVVDILPSERVDHKIVDH